MKYIKTKDGYLLEVIRVSESNKSYITKPKGWVIHKDRVIKQADTFEELCDEFRVRDNDNYSTYEIDITCRDLQELYEELQIQNQTLFGAIWTDKGLIYVAKMNDKGELELL